MLPGMIGALVAPEPRAEYLGLTVDNVDRTAYTFTGVSLGDDDQDRIIVINAHTIDNAANNLNSATIAGISATLINSVHNSPTNARSFASQVYAFVPAGTGATGSVVLTYNDGTFRCHIGVYAIYGLSAHSPISTHTNTGNPLTHTTTPPRGAVIIGASTTFFVSNPSITWAGLTESYDTAGEGSSERYSGAVSSGLAEASTTFSATASSATGQAGVLSIWR